MIREGLTGRHRFGKNARIFKNSRKNFYYAFFSRKMTLLREKEIEKCAYDLGMSRGIKLDINGRFVWKILSPSSRDIINP